jgi:uracil phosphoribosyltransferase
MSEQPSAARSPGLTVFDHPLIRHKLGQLRSKDTGFREFRAALAQISALMLFEATRSLPTSVVRIDTPITTTDALRIRGHLTVVPVLRAGLGMAEGVLELMPEARVAHIGLVRDETTLQPTAYLSKLPSELDAGPVFVLDPMLATGGSAARAVEMLKEAGAADIRFMCLVAAPPGLERFERNHPDVHIYCASVDERLNERGYIVPGLGDAGDRMYGTT